MTGRIETKGSELGEEDAVLLLAPAENEAGFQLADDDRRKQNDLGRRDQIEDARMTGPKMRIGGSIEDQPQGGFSAKGDHRLAAELRVLG